MAPFFGGLRCEPPVARCKPDDCEPAVISQLPGPTAFGYQLSLGRRGSSKFLYPFLAAFGVNPQLPNLTTASLLFRTVVRPPIQADASDNNYASFWMREYCNALYNQFANSGLSADDYASRCDCLLAIASCIAAN